MFLQLLFITSGLALLAGGANLFVNGSAGLAVRLGIPPLLVGVVLIGFATSAPELITGVLAALDGRTIIAVGNALGSNITNLSLVLGAAALVWPVTVASRSIRREYGITFCATLLALGVLWNGMLGQWEGLLLCGSLFLVVLYSILGVRARPQEQPERNPHHEIPGRQRLPWLLLLLSGGLLLLLGGAHLLLSGAVQLAQWAGLSDLVIGLTVVAVGTSLPELAAVLVSAIKRQADLSIGALLGSNTFNALGCIGLPGLLHPAIVERDVLSRDFPVVIGVTLLVGLFLFAPGRQGIGRGAGAVLLSCFIAYQGLLLLNALGGAGGAGP